MDLHEQKLIANAKHQNKVCPNTCYLGSVITLAENLNHRLEYVTEKFNHAQKCIAGMVWHLLGSEKGFDLALKEYESYQDHPVLEKDTPRVKPEPGMTYSSELSDLPDFEKVIKALRERCLFGHDDFRGETTIRVPDHLMKEFDEFVHICPNLFTNRFKESDSDKMIRQLNTNLAASGIDPTTLKERKKLGE